MEAWTCLSPLNAWSKMASNLSLRSRTSCTQRRAWFKAVAPVLGALAFAFPLGSALSSSSSAAGGAAAANALSLMPLPLASTLSRSASRNASLPASSGTRRKSVNNRFRSAMRSPSNMGTRPVPGMRIIACKWGVRRWSTSSACSGSLVSDDR